jgi:hypothetical protein
VMVSESLDDDTTKVVERDFFGDVGERK